MGVVGGLVFRGLGFQMELQKVVSFIGIATIVALNKTLNINLLPVDHFWYNNNNNNPIVRQYNMDHIYSFYIITIFWTDLKLTVDSIHFHFVKSLTLWPRIPGCSSKIAHKEHINWEHCCQECSHKTGGRVCILGHSPSQSVNEYIRSRRYFHLF